MNKEELMQNYIGPAMRFLAFALVFLILFTIATDTPPAPDVPTDTAALPPSAFKDIHKAIEADAAIVWDIKANRALYAYHPEAQLPLASLTKLMTVYTASTLFSGNPIVSIPARAIAAEGDTGLRVGEEWHFTDLAAFTLITSSNDGALALALADREENIGTSTSATIAARPFVQRMNARARSLGLRQTFFLNPSGLDVSKHISGAYGSAYDVARLLEHIIVSRPDLLTETSKYASALISQSGVVHTAENTNEEVVRMPGIMASKTGFTDLAGGNLAVVFEIAPARPIAVVVLGSTKEDRFLDVETLIRATSREFALPLYK